MIMKITPPESQAGLGLVELMVAMAIGLILMLGATGTLLTNQRVFSATEGLSGIQDSSRIAIDLLARDLREAGGHPCLTTSLSDQTNANAKALAIKAQLAQAGSVALNPADNPGNRVAAQSALQMVTITDTQTITAQAGTVLTFANSLAAGDIIIACTGKAAYLLEVTAATPTTATVESVPAADLTGASIASGLDFRFWYIGTNADGRLDSLYRRIGAGNGVEMVDNIVGLATQDLGNGAVRIQLTLCSRNNDSEALAANNQLCAAGRIERTVATVIQRRTA